MNEIFKAEHEHNMLGVAGRFHNRVIDTSTGIFRSQTFTAVRPLKSRDYKPGSTIAVNVRFDDECNNGKQSFAITGDIREPRHGVTAWGCLHDEIAKAFPELAPLIKWHLFDQNSPMHYVSNTCYHAGNLDCSGRAKGEASAWDTYAYFGARLIGVKVNKKFADFLKSRTPEFQVYAIRSNEPDKYSPRYSIIGFADRWHECPFDTEQEAQEFCLALNTLELTIKQQPTKFSEGKERDLAAARSTAVWAEATDEQICLPKDRLTALLLARLPAMVAEFRADMENCGFLWQQEVTV